MYKTRMYPLQSAKSDFAGLMQIAEFFWHGVEAEGPNVDVDCASMRWFDANLAAALGAVARVLRESHGKSIRLSKLDPKVADILACNGLFGNHGVRRRASVIPLTHFQPGDARKFAGYTQDHLSNKGLPAMSAQVTKRVFEGIDELFQNAEIHSLTKLGMYACGQLYPKTNRLDFSIVDMGIGFQEVISRTARVVMRPSAAIDWAMQGRNTTRSGDVPGGLGLKILKEFIQQNGGKLSIMSQRGFWSLNRNGVSTSEIKLPFPGTVVTIEVNMADKSEYRMGYEIDPQSVF